MRQVICLIMLCIVASAKAQASQIYNVKDGETIRVKISRNELTRIKMKNGQVASFKGAKGVLTVSADKKRGEIFITPTPMAAKALSFFVSDKNGATYTLLAEQYDIPSQTIILVSKVKNKKSLKKFKSMPLKKAIKQLIKDMYNNSDSNCDVKTLNEEIKLWNESNILLQKKFINPKYIGQVYTFQNVSEKEMVISEEEFLNIDTDILAVAIEKHKLQKSESTRIFVVKAAK